MPKTYTNPVYPYLRSVDQDAGTAAQHPVIIVGADADPYEKAEARVVGADRFLSLPLTETGLLVAIRQSQCEKPLLIGAGRAGAPGSDWIE